MRNDRLLLMLILMGLAFFSLYLQATPSDADIATNPDGDTVAELAQILEKAQKTCEGTATYRAEVHLRERIRGEIRGVEKIKTLYSRDPFMVYFEWEPDGMLAGTRASYVESRDGAKYFLARGVGLSGLIGATRLEIQGTVAKKLLPHHFDIHQYHLGYLLNYAKEIFDRGRAAGKVTARRLGADQKPLASRGLTYYGVQLSNDPDDGLKYKRCLFGIDAKTSIPFHIDLFDFQDRLHASYQVLSLTLNPKIDSTMFDLP